MITHGRKRVTLSKPCHLDKIERVRSSKTWGNEPPRYSKFGEHWWLASRVWYENSSKFSAPNGGEKWLKRDWKHLVCSFKHVLYTIGRFSTPKMHWWLRFKTWQPTCPTHGGLPSLLWVWLNDWLLVGHDRIFTVYWHLLGSAECHLYGISMGFLPPFQESTAHWQSWHQGHAGPHRRT